jgi:hypothetical protein
MSDIEITVPIDRAHPMIIHTDGHIISLGRKVFLEVAHFKYEWTHDYLSKADTVELIKSLQLAVTLMDEPV